MNNILLQIATAFVFTALAPTIRAAPNIGGDAPDFSLPTADGKTETLAQHKGKFVVLEWTSPACLFVLRHYADGDMQ